MRKSGIELDVLKSKTIFINESISNTMVASMFAKFKHAIKAINKAMQSTTKSQQAVRQTVTPQQGIWSSRAQTVRKMVVVPAD